MAERGPAVLLCGFGAFGALHAAAWREAVDGVRLMIADPSEAARDRARMLVPPEQVAATMDEFLTTTDLIDLVTPPDHHYDAAVKAIDAGKPVLIEKPAVRTLADAIDLSTRAAEAGVPIQVQHVLRAHPLTRRASDMLRSGRIGRLLRMEGDFSGWKRMRADSSLLENDGVHFLDLFHVFADAPADAVDARARHLLGGRVADEIVIDLAYSSGVSGTLRLGVLRAGDSEDAYVPGAVTTKRIRLIGDRGNLEIDFNAGRLFVANVDFEPIEGGWRPVPGDLGWEQSPATGPVALLAETFRIFLDAIDKGRSVLCDLDTGAVAMMRTLGAIDKALTRGPRSMITVGSTA
jgi:predicted dehydrogenase